VNVLMRLPESVTNNMKQEFRPLECICGSSEIVLAEGESGLTALKCEGCGHVGPAAYEASYVECVMMWNGEVVKYEALLEEN